MVLEQSKLAGGLRALFRITQIASGLNVGVSMPAAPRNWNDVIHRSAIKVVIASRLPNAAATQLASPPVPLKNLGGNHYFCITNKPAFPSKPPPLSDSTATIGLHVQVVSSKQLGLKRRVTIATIMTALVTAKSLK